MVSCKLRPYFTPGKGPVVAQRLGRIIVLHFHDRGARRGVSGQLQAPAVLYSRERPGTHCIGVCVGPRAGLNGRKISPPTGIRSPDRPARSSVAIPTELPGPLDTWYWIRNCLLNVLVIICMKKSKPLSSATYSGLMGLFLCITPNVEHLVTQR